MKPITKIMPFRKAKIRGAGDVVHELLKPVVAVSDAVLKTDLKNCHGCNVTRREKLNQILPL